MPKKSMEKPHIEEKSQIEEQQEEIKKAKEERENLENFRKRNYTEEEIKAAEAYELEQTKKRIWREESEEEKTETKYDAETDLDVIRDKLQKEFKRQDEIEQKPKSSSAKASKDKEKKKGKQEKLPDTFKRIKKKSEEKKHLDTTEQEGHIDATTQGERFDIAKQEQKKAEKKFENLKEDELKQDLLTALDKPIENLVENNANIKKCDEKIWDLKKGLIKPLLTYKRRKKIQIEKEVAIEEKAKAKQAIADIENKYILKNCSTETEKTEIRKIIIEKVGEEKGKAQKKTTLELREPRENIDATGQENFDTTKQQGIEPKEHLDATGRGQHLNAEKQKQKKRLDRDKIKRGAIKAGRGAKTGASLFGLFALTATGAWLSFSSAVTEWAKKNNIKI